MATHTAPHTATPDAQAPKPAKKRTSPARRSGDKPGAPAGAATSRARRHAPRPPRFDVEQLLSLAGPPLWQAVHPGTVVEVSDEGVWCEVAPEGHAPRRAWVKRSEWGLPPATLGDQVRVRLGDPPTRDDEPILASRLQALDLDALERISRAQEARETLPGVVVREIKGGFSVALGTRDEADLAHHAGYIRAFMPRSQATYGKGASLETVDHADDFDIHEFESERANVVVSRRARLRARHLEEVKALWQALEEGQVVQATVKSVMPYGAFVDAGGIDGLLHVSDLRWDRAPPAHQALHVGQTLDVKVIKLDRDARKLKVGVKQLTPDPWDEARTRLSPGALIEGDIVALTDFGIFIRVAEGVEGLAHLSELSWERIKHPSVRFRIGQRVQARVLDVDLPNRRMSLSLRALEENPFEVVRQRFAEGTVVRARVKSLTDFGAFVELSESVDGLIHVGEMSWTEQTQHPADVLAVGEEVECVVMSVDVDKQRVACSIKRLTENPWDRWARTYTAGSRHGLVVSRVVDHGVFFQLDEGLTGFCPTRELSSEPLGRAQEVAKPGDTLQVEVRTFDAKNRRVTLSAKAVIEDETRTAYAEYKEREASGDQGRLTLGDAVAAHVAQRREVAPEATSSSADVAAPAAATASPAGVDPTSDIDAAASTIPPTAEGEQG